MPPIRRLPFALLLFAVAASLAPALTARATAEEFAPILSDALPNAYRVTPKVISGGEPQGDAGFAAMLKLGVKTVISVDGARPDVERGRKFGLRYVHLPIGYDGVTDEQGRAIAKAVAELPGPIYLHCHHGNHRSPAAAAVACVLAGQLDPAKAEAVLKTCGTGEEYKGLWAAARMARAAEPGALAALQVAFVETAKVPPTAEAMVGIEETFDRLKASSAAGWRAPAGHPDVDPPHEALQLTEKLRELGRTYDVLRARPAEFRELLSRNEREAQSLHEGLRAWSSGAKAGKQPPQSLDATLKQLGTSCATCHKSYRD